MLQNSLPDPFLTGTFPGYEEEMEGTFIKSEDDSKIGGIPSTLEKNYLKNIKIK